MKPIVAVVGRPNVGKSTLVNRLAQTSDAIVHESRGVTRDRSYHTADWNGREFTIVDTGGIEPLKSDDVFATSIRDQALAAAEEAAVILFVVDGRTGVTEEDESVARMLKRCDKPVFLLVNKLDNPDRENDSIWEFYSLGIGRAHAALGPAWSWHGRPARRYRSPVARGGGRDRRRVPRCAERGYHRPPQRR